MPLSFTQEDFLVSKTAVGNFGKKILFWLVVFSRHIGTPERMEEFLAIFS